MVDVPKRINYFAQVHATLADLLECTGRGVVDRAEMQMHIASAMENLDKAKAQAADRRVVSLADEKTRRTLENLRYFVKAQASAVTILVNGIQDTAVSIVNVCNGNPDLEAKFNPIMANVEAFMQRAASISPQPPKRNDPPETTDA